MEGEFRVVLATFIVVLAVLSGLGVYLNNQAASSYAQNTIPVEYPHIRVVPAIVGEKSLSALLFSANSSAGFTAYTRASNSRFISVFPLIEGGSIRISYVMANFTFQQGTMGLAVILTPANYSSMVIENTRSALVTSLTEAGNASTCSPGMYSKEVGGNMTVYYFSGKVLGQCGFIYTVLKTQGNILALFQYRTLEPPTMTQLQKIASTLIQQYS
ncbi:MAG: hypothetical protein QW767_03590 [Thermoprotei archaeon]